MNNQLKFVETLEPLLKYAIVAVQDPDKLAASQGEENEDAEVVQENETETEKEKGKEKDDDEGMERCFSSLRKALSSVADAATGDTVQSAVANLRSGKTTPAGLRQMLLTYAKSQREHFAAASKTCEQILQRDAFASSLPHSHERKATMESADALDGRDRKQATSSSPSDLHRRLSRAAGSMAAEGKGALPQVG